jgi:hypothetical protein
VKASPRQLEEVRERLQQHQAVTFIGARGTGKATLAGGLRVHLKEVGMVVVAIDAGTTDSAADFNAQLAVALRCPDSALTADCLNQDERIRVIVENCEELHDRAWFPVVQEQWRALLTDETARGRVGALLLGRPLFQDVAGGQGSPLLNIGPVLRARPLTENEIAADFDVDLVAARAIRRKTGGHPELTAILIESGGGDIENLGATVSQFVRDNERYLLRLVEDHTLAGMAVLSDVIEANAPVAEAAVIGAHFARAFSRGQDCLADLAGSGLIVRDADGRCSLGAEVIRKAASVRQFLRAPLANVPADRPGRHVEAASLLYAIENRLRARVAEWLGEVDRAWWPNRVGDQPAAHAESRRQDEMESQVAPQDELHPIMYMHLGEVFDVIASELNWEQVFRVRLPVTREAVKEEAEAIGKVRLKVAHNRPIDDDDLGLLERAARRLRLDA